MYRPDETAELSISGGSNRFFSIDGRPLAAERGVMKDLHKVYRSYLQPRLTNNTHHAGVQFLLLRLSCPKGAYDINVEPAKDVVMFGDSQVVVKLFEDMCIRVYGAKTVPQAVHQPNKVTGRTASISSFNVLLAKDRPQAKEQQALAPSKIHPAIANTGSKAPVEFATPPPSEGASVYAHRSSKAFQNTYGRGDDDNTGMTNASPDGRCDTEIAEEQDDVMDPQVTNPFVLAKMNTRLGPQDITIPSGKAFPHNAVLVASESCGPSALESSGPVSVLVPKRSDPLLSPAFSAERDQPYQNPGPPDRPWTRQKVEQTEGHSDPSQPLTEHRMTLLDAWTQNTNSFSPTQNPSGLIAVKHSDPVHTLGMSFRSPVQSKVQKSAAHPSMNSGKQSQQAPFRTPFKKRTAGQASDSGHHFLSPEATPNLGGHHLTLLPSDTSREPGPGFLGFGPPRMMASTELDDIMDFEHRKRYTILQHREKQAKNPTTSSSGGQPLARDERLLPISPEQRNEGMVIQAPEENTNYATRFASVLKRSDKNDTPLLPSLSSSTHNPHRARYKKAIQDLEERSRPDVGAENVSSSTGKVRSAVDHNSSRERPKLSPNDPRAYLIRHQDEQGVHGKSEKQKRIKTTKLPFETIPTSLETLNLIAIPDASAVYDCASLRKVAEALQPSEPYVHHGPDSFDGTGFGSESFARSDFEPRLRALLENRVMCTPWTSATDATVSNDRVFSATDRICSQACSSNSHVMYGVDYAEIQ